MALVTLEEAKVHLRLAPDDTDHDDDLTAKIDEASAIILRYLKAEGDVTWTDVTVPRDVKAATKIMLGHLMRERGDDDGGTEADERIWAAVGRILVMRRDPALA